MLYNSPLDSLSAHHPFTQGSCFMQWNVTITPGIISASPVWKWVNLKKNYISKFSTDYENHIIEVITFSYYAAIAQ